MSHKNENFQLSPFARWILSQIFQDRDGAKVGDFCEVYQDYSDERIREIYHDREVKGWERYMSIPELRQMVEESGVENLAQLYTVVKYTRASHLEFSKIVLDYLEAQDFMKLA